MHLPESVLLELTNKCNYSCLHCYANANNSTIEYSEIELENVINQIHKLGVRTVALSGGEPFLYSFIWEAIELLKNKGFRVVIDTNGFFLDAMVAKKLKALSIDLINVSLHGYYQWEHDALIGREGAFKSAIRAIELLAENAVPFGINVAINKFNFENCHKIIFIARAFQASCINYFRVFPTGRATENFHDLGISISEHKAVFKRIKELSNLVDNNDILLYTELPYIYKELDWDRTYACGIAEKSFIITNTGDVFLCNALRSKQLLCGNINTQRLDYIWSDSSIFNEVRTIKQNPKNLQGICSSCEYMNLCNGGCKACSYDVYHDFNHSDENCWIKNGDR